jgi:hypothetical protein
MTFAALIVDSLTFAMQGILGCMDAITGTDGY